MIISSAALNLVNKGDKKLVCSCTDHCAVYLPKLRPALSSNRKQTRKRGSRGQNVKKHTNLGSGNLWCQAQYCKLSMFYKKQILPTLLNLTKSDSLRRDVLCKGEMIWDNANQTLDNPSIKFPVIESCDQTWVQELTTKGNPTKNCMLRLLSDQGFKDWITMLLLERISDC